jgi:hypothetical protein
MFVPYALAGDGAREHCVLGGLAIIRCDDRRNDHRRQGCRAFKDLRRT